MKQTTKDVDGTSFHDSTITASVQALKDALGEPVYDANDGQDKTNYEWFMETEKGDVFTIYDWKEYRSLDDDEMVEWHIGGHSGRITEQARLELHKAIYKNL